MLETAITAAKRAGQILLENFRRIETLDIELKGRNNFVTNVDREAENAILEFLRARHPDHAIFAEESGPQTASSDYRWIIDPLDGTTNYIHGYPVFAVSLALEHRGQILLGVTYDPLREELFHAERGRGAYLSGPPDLEGRPIRVSDVETLSESFLATGFPYTVFQGLDAYLDAFRRLLLRSTGIRRAGSAALDLAYVACGRFDGFWEAGLNPWDIAAGSLLIEEAGGRITDFAGGSGHIWSGRVVASNNRIHGELLSILSASFREDTG